VAFVSFIAACSSPPPYGQDAISAVEIRGGSVADDPALRKGLATQEDEVFDEDVLDKDLERIRRYYRSRGYYEALVRAARIVRVGAQKVRVEIEVLPGDPVIVSSLEVVGIDVLPSETAREVRKAVRLRAGEPIVEEQFHGSAREIERLLADRGFAFVKVVEQAEVSVSQRKASVEYLVTPNPKAVYGDVSVEGFGSLDRRVIVAALGIEKGKPYSKRDLDAARRRLFAIGIFSKVEITPNLQNPENPEVPVRVVLAVGTTHSVHLGAVIEQDSIRAMAGLRVGWESRNFFGGMRRFTADTTPGITFYPLSNPDVSLKALPSLLSSVRLEQPAIIDALTTGFVEGNYNVYPVLYSDFSPGDNIIGFQELKGAVGVERPIAGVRFRIRPSYNVQASFPFMYHGEKPEGLDTLVVLFPEIVAEVDFRDDPIEPRKGAYFRLSAQLAGYIVGDADDLRLQPEARLIAKISRSLSFAYRAKFGFLFPNFCNGQYSRGCYGDSLASSSNANASDPAVVRDQQILLFRGFYSGGATSNRGYNLREVGPHGTLGFLVPTNTNCAVPNPPESCIRPLGGLTLWEQSIEFRFLLSNLVGLVLFADASDLTREVMTFRLNFPHLSVGTGFRLRTPVGAARLDIGLRVPYMQEVGAAKLPPDEGNPDTILGAPIALHFGLGEAF
jgi:outer membrane protein insertion porin family/translocation and assembly module TamA